MLVIKKKISNECLLFYDNLSAESLQIAVLTNGPYPYPIRNIPYSRLLALHIHKSSGIKSKNQMAKTILTTQYIGGMVIIYT